MCRRSPRLKHASSSPSATGKNSYHPSRRVYTAKAKGAQEAHEAVRPTGVLRQPDLIKEFLNRDQLRLYQVIWQRFVASQMEAAVFDTLSVEVTGAGEQRVLAARIRLDGKIPGLYDRVRRGKG